jgi:hypothetical protein
MRRAIAATVLVLLLAACGDDSSKSPMASARTPSPAGAKVSIIEPADGATVKSPVTVKFAVEGMEVAPAGTDKPNTGHHHLFIDSKLEDPSVPVPSDANHIHFGKGQTEAQVELTPGKHTLQDVFADKNHIPHDPPVVSDVVTITVE